MGTNRLLILDDDPLIGATIKNIAEFIGLDVHYTPSPERFFTLLEELTPDFIALDLVMPHMDGVQVMAALAERGCKARIIITSGVGSRVLDAAGRSAKEHGLNISGVLAKPFTPAALRKLLTERNPADTLIKGPAPSATPRTSPPEISVTELEHALARQDIAVAYQPKIVCATGRISGVEVLARWQHPEKGWISPEQFIALAENNGLIDDLTKQVMTQGLNWLANLTILGPSPMTQHLLDDVLASITLSLNISARSLSNLELFEWLGDQCNARGIAPNRLILELTETSAMDDPVHSLDILTRLRMQGFQLSIDDFGTGFSSMVQLVRLPFSEIKVDKSFVMTANKSLESRTVIKSIVDLGRSLGLKTTAEGIEDQDMLIYLQDIGCDLAQGYYIGRPMDGEAVAKWVLQRIFAHEEKRLLCIQSLDLLDTPAEERFDRLTHLAKRLFDVPIVLVSIVDHDRQWFKSSIGLDVSETPRDISFCSRAIQWEDVYVVSDTTKDPRFARNSLVIGSPYIRFYAGAILHGPDGNKLGTLCVIDTHTRNFGEREQRLLQDIAWMVEQELAADPRSAIDPVTGLLNRITFEARSRSVLELAKNQKLGVSLLCFELINLKEINEQHGHSAGDEALTLFAKCISKTWRGSDLIGRFSGDKFAVLALDANPSHMSTMVSRFRDSLAQASSTNSFSLSFRVGTSFVDADNPRLLQPLIDEASEKMSREKAIL